MKFFSLQLSCLQDRFKLHEHIYHLLKFLTKTPPQKLQKGPRWSTVRKQYGHSRYPVAVVFSELP